MPRLLLSLLLVVFCVPSWGADMSSGGNSGDVDTLHLTIRFRQGYSDFDYAFAGNSDRLLALIRRIAEWSKTAERRNQVGVTVVAGASPEGATAAQMKLSESRVSTAVDLMRQNGLIGALQPRTIALGEDWEGLDSLVSRTPETPDQLAVLDIIRNTPRYIYDSRGRITGGRKKALMDMGGGYNWRWLLANLFPLLREARVAIRVPKLLLMQLSDEPTRPAPIPVAEEQQRQIAPIMPLAQPTPHYSLLTPPCDCCRSKHFIGMRTNLAYDALAVPNISIEIPLTWQWSITGTWAFSWWSNRYQHHWWRVDAGEIELRRYFGTKRPFYGLHVGAYGQILSYDFRYFGGKGQQSPLSYGGGLSFGYAIPLWRRMAFDFTVGIGYLGGEYKKYRPEGPLDIRTGTYRRNWFGPTKIELSLMWMIGNYREKRTNDVPAVQQPTSNPSPNGASEAFHSSLLTPHSSLDSSSFLTPNLERKEGRP